jgi:biofilm PGA synthesis N-glycosyltransferase PgaC
MPEPVVSMVMDQRLLVISPVRNEAAHIEAVALAIAAQTRPPDAWVVVDDGSADDTRAVLAGLAGRLPYMTVISPPPAVADGVKDRLAAAAAPRAFNAGLDSVDLETFTHIAKLDGDTELPPRYFEQLLGRFAQDAELGLAGGVRIERTERGEILERVPTRHHVPGALKCYSRACFEAIGGMHERLAWDTIDEVYARMRGFRTRAYPELIAVHHRPWGSADGRLRGSVRHGRCAYIVHYPFGWVLLRALKTAGTPPRGASGLAYLWGYLSAAAGPIPKVADREFRTFFRGELRERARDVLAESRPAMRRLRPLAGREG